MMDSRLALITLVLVICPSSLPPAAAFDGITPLQCLQKLITCQTFLKNPENPPALCCTPLKDMIANDTKCLCGVFNNVDILKSMNVTQDQALQLPKACGADADISICEKAAGAPTSSPSFDIPSIPLINGTTPADNNTNNSSASGYGKIASGGVVGLMSFMTTMLVMQL